MTSRFAATWRASIASRARLGLAWPTPGPQLDDDGRKTMPDNDQRAICVSADQRHFPSTSTTDAKQRKLPAVRRRHQRRRNG
jgi:hypothetical protein